MLQQWRAGLRVYEALDLEVRDLSLDTASPTLRVRSGKGGKTRLLAGASGATRGTEQRSGLRGHQPGQNRRGSPHDRMALGEGGGETCRGTGCDCAGEANRDPYAASQLRTAPADEWYPNQLLVTLVRALFDTNNANLPRACAGPDGEFSHSAVTG